MTADENEILKILRAASASATHSSSESRNIYSTANLNAGNDPDFFKRIIVTQSIGDLVSKGIFGIGLFFVALFVGGISALLPDMSNRLIFFGFSIICLFVAVHHIDSTTRSIRKAKRSIDEFE